MTKIANINDISGKMAKKQIISFTLELGDIAIIDYEAAKAKTSRSEIVRRLVKTRRKAAGLAQAEQTGKSLGRLLYKIRRK